MRLISTLIVSLWLASAPALAGYTLHDYGRDCAREIGIGLPPINCLDGDLLPVRENGKHVTDRIPERCDKPTMVNPHASCIPGGRVLKLIRTNAKHETVVTMAVCRHSEAHKSLTDPIFENVAIFQHNLTTDKVCWFQIRKYGGGFDASSVPSPLAAGAEKLYEPFDQVAQGENQCISCHDSQLYLRTPYIRQASAKNAVPNYVSHGKLHHVGEAFAHWNTESYQPVRLRIDTEAYNSLYPPQNGDEKRAEAGYCTSCHAIGQSPLPYPQGTCRALSKEIVEGPGHNPLISDKLSRLATHFPEGYWMPPHGFAKRFGTGPAAEARYRDYFSRAFEALRRCCGNPALEIAGKKVCVP
jgi:hypothetical protein